MKGNQCLHKWKPEAKMLVKQGVSCDVGAPERAAQSVAKAAISANFGNLNRYQVSMTCGSVGNHTGDRQMTEPTRNRLARALRASALAVSPHDVATMEHLAKRAEAGEFDDYSDVHVCGPTAIHGILRSLGKHDLAARVAAGEFDASLEESEAWARSVTDPETKRLMESLGLGPDRSKDQ